MKPTNRIYYPSVDGLRAIAVMSVVLYHAGFQAFSGGFVGVDVFFVISGFLITRNIIDDVSAKKFSLSGFYYRRARRLFPAFIFTVLVSAIFGWLLLSPAHLERFSESVLFAIVSLSNFYFLSESGYFETASAFRPLLHFWSLAVEEQFYLFWPIVLVFLMQIKRGKYIIPTVFLIGCASVVASEYKIDDIPDAVFFLTPFRLVEFAIGALCVWFARYRLANWKHEIGLSAGLALIAYAVFSFDADTVFPGTNALVPCIGAALVILSGGAQLSGWALRSRFLVWIGLISYSLYLIHWPIFVFYKYWKFTPLSLYEGIMLIVVSLIIADLMYRYIEQAYRVSSVEHSRLTPKKFLASSAVGVAVLSITSVHAMNHNGWEWRLNSIENVRVEAEEYKCRDRKEISKNEFTCTLGADVNGRAEILLIGDSHAEHLVTGIDYLGKKNKLKIDVWVHYGCPPIWGTYVMQKFGRSHWRAQCELQVKKWEQLVSARKYNYIILAGRWMNLYELDGYGESKVHTRLLVDRDNPVMDASVSRRLFSDRLRSTVEQINNSGAKAMVVSQVPLLNKNMEDCNRIPGYLLSERHRQERCDDDIEYNAVTLRNQYMDKTIRNLSSDNAKSVILSDYVCDVETRRCNTVIEGAMVYKDDDHLNSTGSLIIAKWLEEDFRQFVK